MFSQLFRSIRKYLFIPASFGSNFGNGTDFQGSESTSFTGGNAEAWIIAENYQKWD